MFQKHISVRVERVPAAQGCRDVEQTLAGDGFVDVQHELWSKDDIFAVCHAGNRPHHIEYVIQPFGAVEYILYCGEVVGVVHHHFYAGRADFGDDPLVDLW